MRTHTIILIFFLVKILFAQNIDSVYQHFITNVSKTNNGINKCGFGIISTLRNNYEKLTNVEKKELHKFLFRPQLQTYVDAINGKFRIHYDTAGVNAPNFSIDELVSSLDTVYSVEFEKANFPLPPADFNNNGGSNAYDIYILNLSNYYGYTTPEDVISSQDSTYTSFIEINSDFTGFYTEGINAAKVTLAHELHHAVQIGNYKMRLSDLYFYELTSTSMEEFVFPYVNDYLEYTSEFFRNTYKAFPDHSGYDLAIWNLFLVEEFGFPILITQWENLRNMRAAFAIKNSIEGEGVSFLNVFKEFGKRIFFTSYRTSIRKYFEDAVSFPIAKNLLTINFPPSYTKEFSLPPFSLAFVSATSPEDSINFMIANGNLDNLFPTPYQLTDYGVAFYNNSTEGENSLADKYSFDFASSDNYSAYQIFINNDFTFSTQGKIDFVYPQPFVVNKHNKLFIPLKTNYSEVKIALYSTDMSLVKEFRKNPITSSGLIEIENKELNIPTGIYIFIISHNGTIEKGKLAVINNK